MSHVRDEGCYPLTAAQEKINFLRLWRRLCCEFEVDLDGCLFGIELMDQVHEAVRADHKSDAAFVAGALLFTLKLGEHFSYLYGVGKFSPTEALSEYEQPLPPHISFSTAGNPLQAISVAMLYLGNYPRAFLDVLRDRVKCMEMYLFRIHPFASHLMLYCSELPSDVLTTITRTLCMAGNLNAKQERFILAFGRTGLIKYHVHAEKGRDENSRKKIDLWPLAAALAFRALILCMPQLLQRFSSPTTFASTETSDREDGECDSRPSNQLEAKLRRSYIHSDLLDVLSDICSKGDVREAILLTRSVVM